MKLVTPNIKREDAHCTTGDQYLGKATRTGPNVKTGAARRINLGKGVKPPDQFQRTPANPGKITGRQLQLGIKTKQPR